MSICPHCAEENPDRARFCLACGSPFARAPTPDLRKTVTIVFTDITGSTGLAEQLDPESFRRVMRRFFDRMRSTLERHGGAVQKFIGDAIMAVFGHPVAHEDDALRAMRAALEMQGELASLNQELEREWGLTLAVRTGVNTGEVVVGDPAAGDSLVVGDAVTVAARLEQQATPGEIVIGEMTHRLGRDAVEAEPIPPLRLRGRSQPVAALRLLGARPLPERGVRSGDAPMVGRVQERRALDEAFRRVVERGGPELVTVLGTAGVGKSRLAAGLIASCRPESQVLFGRCLPYGKGIAFWPVLEVIRESLQLPEGATPEETMTQLRRLLESEDDADRIAPRLGQLLGVADIAAGVEETFWAVRRYLETAARRSPAVVIVDDLHWAEQTLLDLLEHVADRAKGPILLVCLARPDLLDERPRWGRASPHASLIALEPLSTEESRRLVHGLLGQADETLVQRVVDAAEGNPLFLEEIVSMLVDESVVERSEQGWITTQDVEDLLLPPSVLALLTARLDRLDPAERTVVEVASVEGKAFREDTIRAVVMPSADAAPGLDVGVVLDRLVSRDLLRLERTDPHGRRTFAFRHSLLRDAAYRTLPKERRAQLHERLADWLVGAAGALAEYEEILGYHLEEAYRQRQDLGRLDPADERLARRAAGHLGTAGRRALDRGDMPGAANLLQRASILLPPDDRVGLRYKLDLADALVETGRFEVAAEVLDQVAEWGRHLDDSAMEWLARIGRLELRLNVEPGASTEDARHGAEQGLRLFEKLQEPHGLAKAWFLLALACWNEARARETEEALEEAIRHAGEGGDRRLQVECYSLLALPLSWGPTPAADGIAKCRELLQRAGGHPRVEALTLITQGALEAVRGEIDRGRGLVARGRAMLTDLGFSVLAAATSHASAHVEMQAGEPLAAEAFLRDGLDVLQQMGEKAYLSTSASELAEVLYVQERYEEADRYTRLSEENADPQDLGPQILWRTVRAKLLAREGDIRTARTLVRDAIDLAKGTDYLDIYADALLGFAEVARLAGSREEARPAMERAADLLERKGNVRRAARVREGLAELRA